MNYFSSLGNSDLDGSLKIDYTKSNFLTSKYGVPPGTVLGPLLFNSYLKDIFKIYSNGRIVSFADDTAVLYI